MSLEPSRYINTTGKFLTATGQSLQQECHHSEANKDNKVNNCQRCEVLVKQLSSLHVKYVHRTVDSIAVNHQALTVA